MVDAAFAGFRACTGRDARIDKRALHRQAARRGLAVGTLWLTAVALVALAALAADLTTHTGELVAAGTRMLQVLTPYAAVVALSLIAYWVLPMRESTFVILVGLGPMTLARPLVVLSAVTWAVAGSGDWLVWTVALTSGLGVLAVEPVVHHRWYRPA
ncbi:oxidoreductase [Nocardia sp. NRRL S-836]|nr:oxidoreductase [Nocardia sp. NRRL S-836]